MFPIESFASAKQNSSFQKSNWFLADEKKTTRFL